MAIDILPLILLPTMDTERFERCSFSLQDAESLLTISMVELPPFIIHFHKLRWHLVTPQAACTPVLTQGCQMAVAEVVNSPALRHYVTRENVPRDQTRALHHYRIFLGAGVATKRSPNRFSRAATARSRARSRRSPTECDSGCGCAVSEVPLRGCA